ncbi:MAG: ATP-binding cassette domain-containing protein [Pirellulaceae bacterium]|nr:ATP-binding cassette domain-containing protein [Pirellulaceae bacterium]
MSLLQFDCRFRHSSRFALELAFEAGAGVTALVGPSGCGKTTTLRLIAGLLKPDSGRIQLGDRVLFDGTKRVNLPPEQRELGLVFQDYQLFPHLSVEQNLRYGLARNSSSPIDFAHVVEILELRSLLSAWPQSLSGGEKQRTAIGRAILRGPQLLLLDEPLSALDPDLRDSISGYLQRVIGEYQIPTLLVTHDPHGVERLAHSTIRIK